MNPAKKGLGRGLSALFGDIENKSISSDKVSNTILYIAQQPESQIIEDLTLMPAGGAF